MNDLSLQKVVFWCSFKGNISCAKELSGPSGIKNSRWLPDAPFPYKCNSILVIESINLLGPPWIKCLKDFGDTKILAVQPSIFFSGLLLLLQPIISVPKLGLLLSYNLEDFWGITQKWQVVRLMGYHQTTWFSCFQVEFFFFFGWIRTL